MRDLGFLSSRLLPVQRCSPFQPPLFHARLCSGSRNYKNFLSTWTSLSESHQFCLRIVHLTLLSKNCSASPWNPSVVEGCCYFSNSLACCLAQLQQLSVRSSLFSLIKNYENFDFKTASVMLGLPVSFRHVVVVDKSRWTALNIPRYFHGLWSRLPRRTIVSASWFSFISVAQLKLLANIACRS